MHNPCTKRTVGIDPLTRLTPCPRPEGCAPCARLIRSRDCDTGGCLPTGSDRPGRRVGPRRIPADLKPFARHEHGQSRHYRSRRGDHRLSSQHRGASRGVSATMRWCCLARSVRPVQGRAGDDHLVGDFDLDAMRATFGKCDRKRRRGSAFLDHVRSPDGSNGLLAGDIREPVTLIGNDFANVLEATPPPTGWSETAAPTASSVTAGPTISAAARTRTSSSSSRFGTRRGAAGHDPRLRRRRRRHQPQGDRRRRSRTGKPGLRVRRRIASAAPPGNSGPSRARRRRSSSAIPTVTAAPTSRSASSVTTHSRPTISFSDGDPGWLVSNRGP